MAGPAESRMAQLFSADQPFSAELEQPTRPPITIVASSEELERQIKGLQAEVAFLKDHVKRQNDVIQRYQARGVQPVGPEELGAGSGGPATAPTRGDAALQDWLLSARHVSPLFAAYDERIGELEHERDVLQRALTDLRGHCDAIVKENDSLHSQLREHVAELVQRGEQSATEALARGGGLRARELDEWAETQERIDLLMQENDLLQQQTRALRAELDRTRADLATRTQEQASLMQQLADTKAALQRTLEESTALHNEAQRASSEALMEVQTRLGNELSSVRAERDQLREAAQAMEAQLRALQDNDMAAAEQLLQQTQLVEEFRTALEASQARELASARELQRLTDSIRRLSQEANARVEEEKEAARRAAEARHRNLEGLLRTRELEIAELKAQLERSAREVKTLQAEMRGVVARVPGDGIRTATALDEALTRLARTERERDEARIELDSVNAQMSRQRALYEQQRNQLTLQLDDTVRRLRATEAELLQMREERARLTVSVEQLSQRLKEVTTEREAAERQFQLQITQITTTCNTKVREAELQLQEANENHARVTQELQELLETQQAAADKWREECRRATDHMEQAVRALREDAQRQAQRSDELSRRVASLQAERADLLSDRAIQEREAEEQRALVAELEAELADASAALHAASAREAALIREKQELHLALDRANLEREKAQRELTRLRLGDALPTRLSIRAGSVGAGGATSGPATASAGTSVFAGGLVPAPTTVPGLGAGAAGASGTTASAPLPRRSLGRETPPFASPDAASAAGSTLSSSLVGLQRRTPASSGGGARLEVERSAGDSDS